jgi:hypothetical protein
MKDPLDNLTLCLVEAARRPLTGAERQKRRRLKLAAEKAQGLRVPLGDVTLAELQALKAAVGAYALDAPGGTERAATCERLWQRLVAAELKAHGIG